MAQFVRDEDKSLNLLIEGTIKMHWDRSALTDYGSITLSYADMAERVERLHIAFETIGVVPDDNVAICGRNCANWVVSFLSTVTLGAVAVPILHEFKTEQIVNILEHSESRLLFVADNIWKDLKNTDLTARLPRLKAVVSLTDFSILQNCDTGHDGSAEALTSFINDRVEERFKQKYPNGMLPADVNYSRNSGNSLVIINYTSGSTGKSKGVMLSQKNLWSNIQYAIDILGDTIANEGKVISILPMAHMYGLAFEVLSELALGMHIYMLNKLSPTVLSDAFVRIKPTLIVCVPLIIEKIIRKKVLPKLQERHISLLLRLPIVKGIVKKNICKQLTEAFGGRFYEVIIGGAALSDEVSHLLHDIGFRYTVGYGTTECAPLIAYSDYSAYIPGSCGKAIDRMTIRIDSPDPVNTVGEILVKGDCVMLGYYKNEEATREAIDTDGWYHTGDLGLMQADGTLFIKGRSKNMLLGPNGQNIYPEEIEDKLNATPLVAESVVIQRNNRLYALIYPDHDEAANANITTDTLPAALDQTCRDVNKTLPAYEQIAGIKIMQTEFEKTPKKNIKRFLYMDEEV